MISPEIDLHPQAAATACAAQAQLHRQDGEHDQQVDEREHVDQVVAVVAAGLIFVHGFVHLEHVDSEGDVECQQGQNQDAHHEANDTLHFGLPHVKLLLLPLHLLLERRFPAELVALQDALHQAEEKQDGAVGWNNRGVSVRGMITLIINK